MNINNTYGPDLLKTKLNFYSKEELSEIQRSKKKVEIEINKRIQKYRKKFFRLITLMSEKWCK